MSLSFCSSLPPHMALPSSPARWLCPLPLADAALWCLFSYVCSEYQRSWYFICVIGKLTSRRQNKGNRTLRRVRHFFLIGKEARVQLEPWEVEEGMEGNEYAEHMGPPLTFRSRTEQRGRSRPAYRAWRGLQTGVPLAAVWELWVPGEFREGSPTLTGESSSRGPGCLCRQWGLCLNTCFPLGVWCQAEGAHVNSPQ